jgi:exopolysaccharide biosynthesis polyprenyl glycosylphosphotransferase
VRSDRSSIPGRSSHRPLSQERLALLLALGDAIVLVLAYAGAFAIRVWVPLPFTQSLLPAESASLLHHALWIALATQLPLLYLFGLYDRRGLRGSTSATSAAATALSIQLLVVSAWYFFRSDLVFPRTVLVLYTALDIAGVSALRALARAVLLRGEEATRILLVGAPGDVADFERALLDGDGHGRRFAVVGRREASNGSGIEALPTEGVDEIVLVAAESWKDDALGRLLADGLADGLAAQRPRVAVVPTVYDLLVGRLASFSIADVPLIEVVKDPSDSLAWAAKSAVERALAALLAAAVLPICAVAMAAIAATSRGPVLFRQVRVGRAGKPFVMYKLRTMRLDAEAESGPTLASDGDARITPVGRLLRATRIDEIPQLWNVLNGTMSLIGPRPERPEFAERYQREIPGYCERWLVRPGLTGLAQVRGEYHTPPAYKLKYDLAYIYNHSLWLDLRIAAETVKVLLTRRGV